MTRLSLLDLSLMRLALVVAIGCGLANVVLGQGRREVVQGVPGDLVWYEDVEEAIVAQQQGEVVLALDLTRNRLSDLPEGLKSLPDLTYLIANRNRLQGLPKWLPELTDLKVLLADYNRISDFPEVLLGMPQLEQLSLGENYLTGIPLDIDNMTSLQILSLWGNVLASFPASLGNLERLQILDLLHNEMTVEEQDILKALLPEVQLNLSEPCDCEFDTGFSTYPIRNQP
ncbi:MAG: leucine-rich repeat domain-containing protein [Bacteroidetes bacterium]|nr:leucine-rich repeat domain-containing protein [Bacteroidota bacterium]